MTAPADTVTSPPPGSLGLPLLGETLAFLKNPFAFLEDRRTRYGNIFKSHIVGRRMIFLSGTDGAEAFYDEAKISRERAHPYPILDLFGGINMAMFDGPRHKDLKSMALTAFDHAAIAGYLPDLQALTETTLARHARAGEFSATAEIRKLAIEAIAKNVMGLDPGPVTEQLCRDYARVLKGMVSLPVALPGTPYGRARAARDRLFTTLKGLVQERRAHPTNDGLSRILAARAPDGRVYTDEEAVLESHHMVIAGFIVYAMLNEMFRQLRDKPELHARCAAEIAAHAPRGPLTMESLARLTTCTNVVQEAKRYVPILPLAFGRSRTAFTVGNCGVPEDWTVCLALTLCNRDPAIYRDRDTFDPDRFAPARAEHRKHPMAFIPQGAEPPTGHRCLGLDYSTFLALVFLVVLVRDYDWELPAQDFSYRWTTIPPEPRGGLRVRLSAKPAAP